MYAIFAAAINGALSFVLRSIIVKFAFFFALYFVASEILAVAADMLFPKDSEKSLDAAFNQLTPAMWFVIDYFKMDVGIPALISAYLTRFMIRRLPVIG
jgi:hypothetical protein